MMWAEYFLLGLTDAPGELGVMARHNNDFVAARKYFREQGRLGREAPPILEADAEICRAVGNEGMATYNIWQNTNPKDPGLLRTAIDLVRERISRSQALQHRIITENPQSKYVAMAHAWEIIGMDRLSICLIAAGKNEEALQVAEESQRKQKREDPTVTAFSKFFYGNALWYNGRKEEAVKQWNAPSGTCSSPMAFCKEPSVEHNGYLKLMAEAGVDFDSYDEQGFSALDHAVLGSSQDQRDAEPIIEEALLNAFKRDIRRAKPNINENVLEGRAHEELSLRKHQSNLRRQYRTILQEQIRPELRTNYKDIAAKLRGLQKLRTIYAKFLSEDTKERRIFSNFCYVKYSDFRDHGKLPSSSLAQRAVKETETTSEDFIIFFSYRWKGLHRPDDDENSQWRRMSRAVQDFLKIHPEIREETVGIWVVCQNSLLLPNPIDIH